MNILGLLLSKAYRLIYDISSNSNGESNQHLHLPVLSSDLICFLVGDGPGSTSSESLYRPQNLSKILSTLYKPKSKDGVGTIPGVRKQKTQAPTVVNFTVRAFYQEI